MSSAVHRYRGTWLAVAGDAGDLTDGWSGHDSNSRLKSAVVNRLFV